MSAAVAASEGGGRLAGDIRRRAEGIEQARRMPADLAAEMAAAGMFRLLVPACHGGAEVHPQSFFDAVAATSQADGAVGWCQMIGVTTGLLSASLSETWAAELYGSHPDVITTGVTAPLGRARRVDGGIEVTGRWPFGSGCQISDWICGGSLMMTDDGPERSDNGAPRVLLPFFPAAEVIIHDDTWDTSGLRGTGSHDIEVQGAFVPEGRWVELGGRPRVDRPLYRFPTFGLLALGVSAVAIGIARHAREAFLDLATEKVPTGSARTLAQRSSAQKELAQATALIDSAAALTREAIEEAWMLASDTGRLPVGTKARLRLAATNNAWSAAHAVDLLYHAAGGTAVYSKSPLQRCFRDVHVATQHLMVAQPTYEVVGRVALGLDPKSPL